MQGQSYTASPKGWLIFFVFFAASMGSLQAQNEVTGKILAASQSPISYVNVLLLNSLDSSLAMGVFSDETGVYQLDHIPNGQYLLRYSMVGYEEQYSKAIDFDGKTRSSKQEAVILLENSNQLAEVAVVAARPFLERKIDRTVVNVANSITNAGGNALQVLQRSPGVQVNTLTKTIALAGKQGVLVMINGKISQMPSEALVDMLAGMNSDNIDRIELIHTPPSNFDAEGNAGIINIILKNTGDEGFNGGYSAKIGYGRGAKHGAGTYFNFRKNKANIFGNYDYDYNLNPQVFSNYRKVRQGNDFLETDTRSNRPHTPTTTQNARLGVDFNLGKNTVLGFVGNFSDRNWYMEAVNETRYATNGITDSLLRMPNSETNHSRTVSGNINLAQKITATQSLNIDLDLIQVDINNPSLYALENLNGSGQITSTSGLRIGKTTPIKVGVAKTDYTADFGKNTKLEAGLKYSVLLFDNDVRVESKESQSDWSVIPDLTSLVSLNEHIAAAYSSVSTAINPKTEVKIGLRYEYTQTNLGSVEQPNIVDRQYGSLFPSVFLSRKISEDRNLSLSYSRRISRPTLRHLAPWLIFSDPTTLESGNPALQPAFTDGFNLDYGHKTWRAGLSFGIQKEPMRFVPQIDRVTNRQVNLMRNLGREYNAGGFVYIPWKINKWLETSNTFYANGKRLNFSLEGKDLTIENFNYGLNISQTMRLPKKITVELTENFDSPGYWGIAYWNAVGSVNIGLEKDFGGNWGKLRASANDLFLSTNYFGTTDQPEIDLLVRSSYQMAERVFMLSWSNTFGNNKLKSARQRQTGSADESQRL